MINQKNVFEWTHWLIGDLLYEQKPRFDELDSTRLWGFYDLAHKKINKHINLKSSLNKILDNSPEDLDNYIKSSLNMARKYFQFSQMEAYREGKDKNTTYIVIKFRQYKNKFINYLEYQRLLGAFLVGMYFST